ncbi:hypothetical protein DB88DRAFT_483752 [Papiliotrema laurentii]|uniref:Borealin N-terminal domain-containing protein n=1 Tax=Papiliotrema laurentii TaxID=5418 RepID=A0AAD9L6G3_PAPLA|nr:hypothetical protein DB88DRAFT_483752 [Papiliotrema laurentii]
MATKVQRAVAMSTPPRSAKPRSVYSEQEKRSLLENYDLEVEDKTRAFNSALAATLSSFMLRQEAEILKIPRDLRSMTLGQLEAQWGGSWAGTVQRIAREKMEEREREEAAQREKARLEEEAKGKRKRAEDEASASSRTSKNARKDASGSNAKIPLSASKRRLTSKTPRSKPIASGSSSGPSGLPQNHIFNPLLPTTPGFARRPRRNESFFSANGSPIVILGSAESPSSDALANEAASDDRITDDSDDDDLPDPEAMETKLLAQRATTPPDSKPSRRPKRAPSLFFRQSIAPNDLVARDTVGEDDGPPLEPELASIPLSDGRTVTFNPLDLSPGRIDAEMEQGGLGENEKVRVKSKVKDAVFQALTAKMEKWKVLG